MPRSILMGLVTVIGFAGASAAWAMPTMPVSTSDTMSALPVQYAACPPGYKITSHGGCKLSHYLRHHPAQNPNNYYEAQPRRYYDGYERPQYRDQQNDYGDDD